ncbi:hypothetical protein GC207_09910 [bacterium]|nr:hypothetical protein [bacterium]
MKFTKYLPIVCGVLLGLLFIMAGVVVLFNLVDAPPPPEGTPAAHFFAAFGPTGYFKFVKVFEILGGLLVMIPRTRNLGLLILGPILVNILAYDVFIMRGTTLIDPMLWVIVAMAFYLLWVERKAFLGLVR